MNRKDPKMKIEWIPDADLPAETLLKMEKCAEQCAAAEGIELSCAINVRLCDDASIATLNQTQRGVPRATDVLSFPTVNYPSGQTAGMCEHLLRKEYDDESGACFLGDIVISVPHLKAQAKSYGHSEEREACYLLVHGICHLMGYDHMQDEDKIKMRGMEEKILHSLAISRN